MPYDTDNRSGITKNASESQKNLAICEIFLFMCSGDVGSPAKSGGAVLRITILRAFSLQMVIPRQGWKGSVGRHSEQPSNAWKQVA